MTRPASIRALQDTVDQLSAAAGELLLTCLAVGIGVLAAAATISLALSTIATAYARVRAQRVQQSRRE